MSDTDSAIRKGIRYVGRLMMMKKLAVLALFFLFDSFGRGHQPERGRVPHKHQTARLKELLLSKWKGIS